jgi:hypothetical protein
MQAKVELQRAAAIALADLTNSKEPKFDKLSAPDGAEGDDRGEGSQPSISDQRNEVALTKADLVKAKAALGVLSKARETLLKDMAAVQAALGGDAAVDEYGNAVGQEEWLKVRCLCSCTPFAPCLQWSAEGGGKADALRGHATLELTHLTRSAVATDQAQQAPRLASLPAALAGRATMLAEEGPRGDGNEVLTNVSKAWDDYMDATDPSHVNEGDVRHQLRKDVAKGADDLGKALNNFAEAEAAPNFKTINPEHDGWAWGRKHREVKTPAKVKVLARKGVGVAKEGPKLQFCQWGSQQVPCAPGYGGAWIEDHPQDSGETIARGGARPALLACAASLLASV